MFGRKHVGQDIVWAGLRRLSRESNGFVNLGSRRPFDFFKCGLYPPQPSQQLARPRDGIPRQPVAQFVAPFHSHIHIPRGANVPSPSEGSELEKRRASPASGSVYRLSSGFVNRDHVVSVGNRTGNPMESARLMKVVEESALG
jgi:hypothetical protein